MQPTALRTFFTCRPVALTLLFITLHCTCVRAQTLDSLRAELLRENPELRALHYDYEAARLIADQQDQLPDLEIGAGVFILPVETRTGPQQFRVGATQMLPWPGKLAAMAELANARAQPILEQAAARQLTLLYQLESAYVRLAGLEAQITVLQQNLELYESLSALALRRVESNQGSSADVYRLQIEQQQIIRNIEKLRLQGREQMVLINELLDRPLNLPVNPTLNLDAQAAAALEKVTAMDLNQLNFSQLPSLRQFVLQEQISEAAIRLSDLDARPGFGLGVDYIAVGQRKDVDLPQSGRDVVMARAMVRVPLSKRKFTAKRNEEQLRLRAISTQREGRLTQLRALVARALIDLETAATELDYLQAQRTALSAAITVAQTELANTQRSLDELLRLQEQQLRYHNEAVRARTTILLQLAVLRRYLIID